MKPKILLTILLLTMLAVSLMDRFPAPQTIVVENDVADASGINASLPSQTAYDPYFILENRSEIFIQRAAAK